MQDTIVDFIRHGEPEGGRAYRGSRIDDPLSAKGWAQMWAALNDRCPWSQIVTSPLQRCRAFAEAVGERHAVPLAVESRFKEVGFGAWEGRTPDEIRTTSPAEYAAFYQDPVHNRPAGAEPLADFFCRVAAAYEDLLSRYPGQRVLVVAHAGVIRAVVAHVLNAEWQRAYRLKVSNASFTRCRQGAQGAVLEFHNCPSV